MKSSLRLLSAALILGTGGLFALNPAHAGCGFVPAVKPSAWDSTEQTGVPLRQAVYSPGSGPRFLPVADDAGHGLGGWNYESGIVGMWRFQMVTTAPNGTSALVDDGYAQWHADGTEIQNSGLHAPKTSNFCLGVWKQTGPDTYRLNHFPMAWDATGDNPSNPIQLTMSVKLVDHDHFAGTYTLKVYTWDGTELTNASGPPVAVIKGTVSAVRVTIDSVVPGSM